MALRSPHGIGKVVLYSGMYQFAPRCAGGSALLCRGGRGHTSHSRWPCTGFVFAKAGKPGQLLVSTRTKPAGVAQVTGKRGRPGTAGQPPFRTGETGYERQYRSNYNLADPVDQWGVIGLVTPRERKGSREAG